MQKYLGVMLIFQLCFFTEIVKQSWSQPILEIYENSSESFKKAYIGKVIAKIKIKQLLF